MINKKYLPSKNFTRALSVAVSLVVIAIIFIYLQPIVSNYLSKNKIADTNEAPVIANIDLDSDNDGLVDWKENLYGTDPKKVDTDGDGTSDVDEITQGRDPLKANTAPAGQEPNDKIDPAIIEENKTKLEEYQNLNPMDKFSRDFMSNIIATQPTNGKIDQDSANMIINKALNTLPENNYAGITKMGDLNLQKTDNSNLDANMSNYRNNFKRETQKITNTFGNDLAMIYSIISNGNSSSTKKEMLKISEEYQSIATNLIKMPVPVAIGYYDVSYHLKIINDLEILVAMDKSLADYDENSLGIFSIITTYQNTIDDLLSTLITVDNILKISR